MFPTPARPCSSAAPSMISACSGTGAPAKRSRDGRDGGNSPRKYDHRHDMSKSFDPVCSLGDELFFLHLRRTLYRLFLEHEVGIHRLICNSISDVYLSRQYIYIYICDNIYVFLLRVMLYMFYVTADRGVVESPRFFDPRPPRSWLRQPR